MKNQTTSTKTVQNFILVILAILLVYQVILTAKVFDFQPIRLGKADSPISAFQDPGDLSAYRWIEMAKGYERLGLLNPRLSPAELEAYRWQAMAQGYADLGLLNYHDNPDDLSAYRWQAMAEAYQKMGLLNTP